MEKFKASLIKDNMVHFDSFGIGIFYYSIIDPEDGIRYQFQVPLSDIGSGRLLATDKAIYFMRWIRKAIEAKEFIKIWN